MNTTHMKAYFESSQKTIFTKRDMKAYFEDQGFAKYKTFQSLQSSLRKDVTSAFILELDADVYCYPQKETSAERALPTLDADFSVFLTGEWLRLWRSYNRLQDSKSR